MDAREVGRHIAMGRRRRGLSQVVLAGLVGRSESWLSQVERGRRTVDSHAVLTELSETLGIEVAELTVREAGVTVTTYRPMGEITDAMTAYASLPAAIGQARASGEAPRLA